jgi:hypothetical protein
MTYFFLEEVPLSLVKKPGTHQGRALLFVPFETRQPQSLNQGMVYKGQHSSPLLPLKELHPPK